MPFGRLKKIVQSLRFRLTAWVMLIVFLVVGITMLSVRAVVLRTIYAEFDQHLQQDMVDISQAVKKDFPNEESQFFKSMNLKALRHIHVDWFVQLFDDRGKLIGATANAPSLVPPQVPVTHKKMWDEASMRVLEAPIDDSSIKPRIIRLGSSRVSMEDDVALLNWIMVMASALILVLAPLSGYFLAGRATRPLNWIIATTAHLEPKKLDKRLPIRGTGDELDQLSETINGMLDRIGKYIDSNRDFIANAAHELRSPLAAIRGSVDVALNRTRTPEEYAALLTDVAEECARLTNLVNRLLLLAEGDAGGLAPTNHQAQLDKVVSESFNMFEAVAESKGVELKLINLTPTLVAGEEYHLRQVVRNLLDNAIKFTPAQGRITVDLVTNRDKKQTTLRVSDSGIGIAPENLSRIFERFYRVDKSRKRENSPGGSGLGLAICQAIISALHGTIQVQSRPGQGSVFTVTLPAL